MLVGGNQIKLQALKIANWLPMKHLNFSDGWASTSAQRVQLLFTNKTYSITDF